MKRKIGKIVIPALILSMLVWGIVFWVFIVPAYARPVSGTISDKLGAFTGAGSGQGHNIKASLDLAHTDLDLGLEDFEDTLAILGLGTGSVFYVDSAATGDADGTTWANAVVTVEGAIAECTASAGDYILVAPGHGETASTTTLDIDKNGITIIGLGKGNERPTYTYDGATDVVTFGASGDHCSIQNFRFVSSVTAVANAIVVEAGCTDFVIKDCVFEAEATTVDEFIDTILISGTASDRGKIINCRFLGDVGANADPKSSINFVDCDYLQIIGNEFSGDIGDAHIFNETTASNYITIKDNLIYNGYIGGNLDITPCISLVAATTGWISNNMCVTNVATPDLAIVAADCYLFENYYNESQGGAFGGQRVGTRAGETYCSTMTATSTNDDLFDVSGGPILITSFTGVVTVQIGSVANTIAIDLNADAGWIDSDFSTAVETNADIVGTRYLFSNAIESVLTPVSDTAGNTSIMNAWYCGEGMIEQSASGATTGAIKWYMTWIPFDDGTIVTPQ